MVLEDGFESHPFFSWAADNFNQVYFLPGNHEYYSGYPLSIESHLFEKIRSNVILINNAMIELKNTCLIFSTLWSHISPGKALLIRRRIADFGHIICEGELLSIDKFNEIHQHDLDFLQRALKNNSNLNKIVITHHVPTYLCQPPEYRGSDLSEGFIVELKHIIANNDIDYWIYGHSHKNLPPVDIGGTRLLTNQLGYIEMDEQRSFNPEAMINCP